STPASSGITSLLPPVNAGRVENKGFEFSLAYNAKIGSDLQLKAGMNGGYAKNEVIFMDEMPGAPDYQRQEGKPIGAFLAYKYAGLFFDEADIAKNTINYSGVTGQLIPGDMKFEDVDGNDTINANDH